MGEEAANRGKAAAPTPPAAATISESQFLSWKRQKDAVAAAAKAEASRKREDEIAAGLVQMNGRELFEREPWVFDNTLY